MKKILLLTALLAITLTVSACNADGTLDEKQINAFIDNTMTTSELATYDGSNGNPVYIAVDGVIYDVTEQFPDGTHQNMFIGGKDVTTIFEGSPHMASMLLDLTTVGRLVATDQTNETTTTETTETTQSNETLPVMTLDELATYTGANGSTAYIAVSGVIYDVTNEFSNGSHQGMQLGGTDATSVFEMSPHALSILDRLPIVGTLEGFPTLTVTETTNNNETYVDEDDEYDDEYEEDEYEDDEYEDEYENETYLLITDLPDSINDYINTNYPNLTIDEIELEDGYYEVEFTNEFELYFDLSGNFLSSEYDD